MKYIVEPKSRGFDVVDTTAVPRADGIWCYCADIERARVIAKLLNDRDDRELINRHARELNDEGNDSAAYQDLSVAARERNWPDPITSAIPGPHSVRISGRPRPD